jgi:hypothetical protein
MSSTPEGRDRIDPADVAFAQRIADAYAPAPLTPSRRAAFDAELETRLARDRWRFAPWAAAATVAGAAALLLLTLLPAAPRDEVAERTDDAAAEEEFVLAIAGDSSDEFVGSLPTDYQAIASLLDY